MRLRISTALAAVALVYAGWAFGAGEAAVPANCAEMTAKDLVGMENPADSPVKVEVTAKSASLKDGVRLRVSIENTSSAPYALTVCTNMLMCCVKGLHPMVAFEGTGMGLLDVCKDKKAASDPREMFLPVNAAFSFDLKIPVSRLPGPTQKKDAELSAFVCFELGEGKLFHSNVAKIKLVE